MKEVQPLHTALTIAGTDPTGGAGLQADLKTFTALHVYGMGVVTAVVAQNTLGVHAVKIGMVSAIPIIKTIAEKLMQYKPQNIVLDTVMVSTSGHSLLAPEAEQYLVDTLIPLAGIITPNIPEAEGLCGFSVQNADDMVKAAEHIAKIYGGAILINGGHLDECSDDLLFTEGRIHWLPGKRVNTANTHGTGCTLSSAIAAGLARGWDILSSVRLAKQYVTGALNSGLDLGRGNGPVNHCCPVPDAYRA